MHSDRVERTVRDAIRETLDRQHGPHPTWIDSPAARRVAGREDGRRRLGLRVLAVAAAIGVVGGAALFAGNTVVRPPTTSQSAPSDCGKLAGVRGTVLDCSRDGSRLLIQKGDWSLFVHDADGSETQVTEPLAEYKKIVGSGATIGATISPDGSRVVFAGLTEIGAACHNGALFAVGAAGGPAELLWKSHIPQNGIVRDPTFSPDGARIAFTDGYCDWGHTVWVMNADGNDVHEILSIERMVGAGHMRGLAWSPAGDRLAVSFIPADPAAGIYTFAMDGSDFTTGDGIGYCWRGVKC